MTLFKTLIISLKPQFNYLSSNHTNNMTYSEKTVSRILKLDFNDDCLDISLRLLVLEYMRRAAIICKDFDLRESRPFFDIAQAVNPTIRANFKDLERMDTHFKKTTHPIYYNVWTYRICEWALHFSALQDHCPNLSIQSPYDPLITLYERHGSFVMKNEILIDGGGISITNWRDRDYPDPILDLDS